ncbi:hypothetical protein DID88_008346 [Monilinia fructigena]|uniref:Integrase catalytic domain-containing protein n=2 Tax=Monilinia fructigena TaxID=38457 RepID=A0A395J7G8_9HELO|nr:hypothetical protein DID88_008346 [Monilinia fructigena]
MSDNDNTATPVKGTINKDTYTEEEEEECEEWLDTVKEQQNDDEPIVFDAKAFTTYVRFKRKQYNCEDINDGELAEIFHNDFKVFTAAQFAKIHQIDARKLRMVLRTRGVYIPKTRVEASTVLYEQSRKSTTDVWTKEQVQEVLKDSNIEEPKFKSGIVRDFIKNNFKYKEEDDDDGDMYGGGGDPDDDGDDDDNNSHRGRRPSWDKRPSKHSNTQSLVSLSKFYTNEEKYGGDDDNFDFKLSIFYEITRRAEVPMDMQYKAFPIMLKDSALEFFHANYESLPPTFKELCTYMRNNFEGDEYQRNMLSKWNSITLKSTKKENKNKPLSECLTIMIKQLRMLQHRLDPAMRQTSHLHNKLILACEDVEACNLACFDPKKEVSGLINQLRQSINTWERSHKNEEDAVLFTDRRFRSNNGNDRNGSRDSRNSNFRSNNFRNNSYNKSRHSNSSNQRNQCWICKKEGCRSTKHSKEEQDKQRREYREKIKGGSNNAFNKRYDQWMIEYEGEATDAESDSETEMGLFFADLDIEDDADEAFFVSSEPISGQEVFNQLSINTILHTMTRDPVEATLPTESAVDIFYTSYTSKEFYGICIDTACAGKSTVGIGQYHAWKQICPVTYDPQTAGAANVRFGKGTATSIGSFRVIAPFGDVDFHIVDADIPFLLSLEDMDRLKAFYNNITDQFITPNGQYSVIRRRGHAFLTWKVDMNQLIQESICQNDCYLTTTELQRLHRRFGHPSAQRFHQVLQRAGYDENNDAIKHLTKYCKHCQMHSKSPGRFRFTLPEDTEFNYAIYVDVMYIAGEPVLHIVDEATRYQAARFLDNISAKHTFDTLRECWIDVYIGPPDYIIHDAGKNFVSKEFVQNAKSISITTKSVPVEAHNSVGIVERYHHPLRRAYEILTKELEDDNLTKVMVLQMAVKAVNDTAGPNGLVPTLLVYGTYPRLSDINPPTATIIQRAKATKKAMAEVRHIRAKRQVTEALRLRNGPSTTSVLTLPLNSEVLVWREGKGGNISGKWTGPHPLIGTDGETCEVELSSGPTKFRSTSVRPFYTEPEEIEENDGSTNDDDGDTIVVDTSRMEAPRPQTPPPAVQPDVQLRRRMRSNLTNMVNIIDIDTNPPQLTVFLQENTPMRYTESRRKEVDGLMENGVFKIVSKASIPPGTRLFKSRFVDEMKDEGTDKAYAKSRLVVQAYQDEGKTTVLTQSPTIQRVSQRIVLALAAILRASNKHIQVYLRDITQAYTQSTTTLNRPIYMEAPKEVGLEDGYVLYVIKPLYGIPEAGNHWFGTYHNHHRDKLNMTQSTYDPCLLYSNDSIGIVGLQTDDTLIVAVERFAHLEQEQLGKAHFMAKNREQLTEDHPLKFNGGLITLKGDKIYLNQEKQCNNIRMVTPGNVDMHGTRGKVRKNVTSKNQYVAQRARGAYIATVCQPEASYHLSVAAQVIDPKEEDAVKLNKVIKWQMDNPTRGLTFVPLDMDSIQLVVFTDASFANNTDLSSQIGYVICLMDKHNNANIIHWTSIKCKRITRSVLASELYALVLGFDVGAAIKGTVNAILKLKKPIPLILCTDSKSLYDLLTKLGTSAEKRLLIDIMALRQCYENREITEIKWIDGKSNPADAMTKNGACQALKDLIDTNKIVIKETHWVERE